MVRGPPEDGSRGWIALEVEAPPPGEEIYAAEALRRIGGRGIVRDGSTIVAHLPPGDRVEARVAEAAAALRSGTSMRAPRVSWRRLSASEEQALWADLAAVRHVSPGLVVAPPGARVEGGDGATSIVIRIEPGPAFGNADHPTTRSCLVLLERLVRRGDRVLDVGAGSGVLAIAAARLGAEQVLALEADRVACRAARRNVALNGRGAAAVTVRHQKVDAAVLERLGPFDGIAANLGTGIVLPLMEALAAARSPGGWLVLSGIPRGEAPIVRAAAERGGPALVREIVEEGWWTASFGEGNGGRSRVFDEEHAPGT